MAEAVVAVHWVVVEAAEAAAEVAVEAVEEAQLPRDQLYAITSPSPVPHLRTRVI